MKGRSQLNYFKEGELEKGSSGSGGSGLGEDDELLSFIFSFILVKAVSVFFTVGLSLYSHLLHLILLFLPFTFGNFVLWLCSFRLKCKIFMYYFHDISCDSNIFYQHGFPLLWISYFYGTSSHQTKTKTNLSTHPPNLSILTTVTITSNKQKDSS